MLYAKYAQVDRCPVYGDSCSSHDDCKHVLCHKEILCLPAGPGDNWRCVRHDTGIHGLHRG